MSNLKYAVPQCPIDTTFSLFSPRGARLATRVWATKTPKALCLFVHGGGWHSGYFEDLATALRNEDIFCASYDQIGCGYSEPDPDSPSPEVAHVRSFDWFVEDLCAAIQWMQKEAAAFITSDTPVFLFGESFGALQVIAAAFEKDDYNVKIDGVISSGGLLRLGEQFLPPGPVVKVLLFISKYYPKLVMPATDFESTFDDAFGDKNWAKTARADPKISIQLKPSLGGVAATLGTGDRLRPKAKEFPVKFYAIHGKNDVRTSCTAMEEFVDRIGPDKASIDIIDTHGHQLLQDTPEISKDVIKKIKTWILNTVSNLN